MSITLATAGLSQEQLAQARMVYGLTGYFDYGLTFDPTVIPGEHIAKWIPRFQQFLRETDAPVEEMQSFENLRAQLLGVEPDVIEGESKPAPAARKAKAPAADPVHCGAIDYAAVINQMQQEQAA